MAYVYRAVVNSEDPGILKTIKVRFKQPVKPQDKLTVNGKVISSENNLVKIDLFVENQNHEQVITNALASLKY